MAKTDWSALQAEFTREHMRTGIGAQEWCAKKGLNYATAKRHIKGYTVKGEVNSILSNSGEHLPDVAKDGKGKVRKIMRSKKCAKKSAHSQKEQGSAQNEEEPVSSDNSEREENNAERDSSGRFQPGNKTGRGNRGNPMPVCSIKPGERRALTHGGYAKYLKADEYFEDARNMSLTDELDFSRARTISLTKTLESLAEIAHNPDNDSATRIDAISKMLAAEAALDRNTGRIESLERTIDQLYVSTVNVPRLKADTQRIIAATSKLKAETEKLTAEGRGVTTPMTEVIGDIQALGNDGMMS